MSKIRVRNKRQKSLEMKGIVCAVVSSLPTNGASLDFAQGIRFPSMGFLIFLATVHLGFFLERWNFSVP
jgi:hypothetical protein